MFNNKTPKKPCCKSCGDGDECESKKPKKQKIKRDFKNK